MQSLLGRVAIVTGAGRGIGRAIAMELALAGADIVVAGRDLRALEVTAAGIEQHGRRALAVPVDVTREDLVRAMIDQAHSRLGPVGILVNNAAIIGPTARVDQVSPADWEEVLAVNLTGAFLCCRAVLPRMIERRSGKIINIASMAGKMAYAMRSPYAVSKWGLIGLTLTLARELGEHQIQVNAVCPGPVDGERMQHVIKSRAQELGQSAEAIQREYVARSAMKRMVSEQDVAGVVAFLASPRADNITGQAVDVSAGYGL